MGKSIMQKKFPQRAGLAASVPQDEIHGTLPPRRPLIFTTVEEKPRPVYFSSGNGGRGGLGRKKVFGRSTKCHI